MSANPNLNLVPKRKLYLMKALTEVENSRQLYRFSKKILIQIAAKLYILKKIFTCIVSQYFNQMSNGQSSGKLRGILFRVLG